MAKSKTGSSAAPTSSDLELRLDVLMHLSDLPGVPGQEDAVRDFVLAELDGLAIRLPAEHASTPGASARPARTAVPEAPPDSPRPQPGVQDADASAI